MSVVQRYQLSAYINLAQLYTALPCWLRTASPCCQQQSYLLWAHAQLFLVGHKDLQVLADTFLHKGLAVGGDGGMDLQQQQEQKYSVGLPPDAGSGQSLYCP
jgi:hypothetical protein